MNSIVTLRERIFEGAVHVCVYIGKLIFVLPLICDNDFPNQVLVLGNLTNLNNR